MAASTLPPDAAPGGAEVAGLRVTHDGPTLHIRLDRPEARNAIAPPMYDRMRTALESAADDPALCSVVVSAAGPAFCAGNDVAGLDLVRRLPKEQRPGYRFMQALLGFPKPVIAAVGGSAVGIGATMLLHCDLVYCTPDARFHLPFTRLGLVPEFASSHLLPRMAGHARAARWLLLGDAMTAAEARDIGFVTDIVDAVPVEDHARAIAQRIAGLPPLSVRATKRLMRRSDRDRVAEVVAFEMDALTERMASEETATLIARLRSPSGK